MQYSVIVYIKLLTARYFYMIFSLAGWGRFGR